MAAAAPFAMKAMPWIIKGGSAIAGSLLGKKLSGPSKEQQAGMTGAQNAINTLGSYAQPLMSQGFGMAQRGGQNLDAATNYYMGVMGNRGQALSHLAPEISNTLDFYRGSAGKIGRNLQGGSRDYALAELERQKVGQIAGLVPAARRTAAEGLGDLGGRYGALGSAFTGQGLSAAGGAANASTQLFGMANDIQKQQAEGGKTMGGFIYDILKSSPLGKMGGGGGGAAPGLPSMPASYMPALLGQNRP